MSMLPAPDVESADRHRAWSRAVHEHQVAMLGELAEIGMKLARSLGDQAHATPGSEEILAAADVAPPAEPDHRAFLAYAKVARAIRMCLLLQSRAVDRAGHLDTLALADRPARVERRKDHIEHIIERVAETAHGAERVESLLFETVARLEHDDLYGDILSRPLSELIAHICQDLGLDPDWPKLAQEAWAREEMASSRVGQPLAEFELTDLPLSGDGDRRRGWRGTSAPEADEAGPPIFQPPDFPAGPFPQWPSN